MALLGCVGTECDLGVSMAAALALTVKCACLLFMEPRDLLKEVDIYLVTRLVAWHCSNLCQAPEERQPNPVLSV